jgi:hypothetical protein
MGSLGWWKERDGETDKERIKRQESRTKKVIGLLSRRVIGSMQYQKQRTGEREKRREKQHRRASPLNFLL